MENPHFITQQEKLSTQKKIIESFISYLSTITKAMNEGEYNIKMINDICTIIQDYYSKNTESTEEDEEDEEEESKEETSSELGNINDGELANMQDGELANMQDGELANMQESEDDSSTPSPPKLQLVEEKKNINSNLYEEFINPNENLRSMLSNPSYNVENNLKNFIDNSNKY